MARAALHELIHVPVYCLSLPPGARVLGGAWSHRAVTCGTSFPTREADPVCVGVWAPRFLHRGEQT